jgi:Tfp pilus assembly protein PilV
MRDNKGVLLIETLLAVTILSAGLIVLLEASMAGLRAGAEAGDQYRASLIVERRAWELETAGKADAFGGEAEDPSLGPVAWSAEQKEVPTLTPDRVPGWQCWNVSVSWNRRGRANNLVLPVGLPKP